MKYYFIRADIGENMPSYEFILQAEAIEEADEKAEEIIKTDYQEYGSPDFSCREIADFQKDILELMCIN
jgi:hypothetical protein